MSSVLKAVDLASAAAIAIPGELLELVLGLLDVTQREISRNEELARLHLARAASLLRAERDQLVPAAPEQNGGLARWKRQLVLAYIEENLSRSIRLGDLAAVAQLSASHFTRAFKLAFRETPRAYVNYRRMARSMQLMLETDEPLSQVAVACGLSDQSHLTRLFHSAHGVSPARWRRLRREALKSAAPTQSAPPPPVTIHRAAA